MFDKTIDRSKRIFGSEAGAILGLDPWKSPLQVWLQKTGQAADEVQASDAITLGNALEGAVADIYAARTGHVLVPSDTILHPTLPIGGTPDRLSEDDSSLGVEVKTVWSGRSANKWGEEGTANVPPHYATQATLYMALTGRERWDFAALMYGQVRVYTMWRDRAKEQEMLDYLCKWWDNHVVAGTPPEPTGSEADLQYLKTRWSETTGEVLQANEAVSNIVTTYIQSKDMIASLESTMSAQEAVLKSIIADADGLHGEGFKISWRHRKPSQTVNWQNVCAELAADDSERLREAIARNTILQGGTRVFTVRKTKKDD